MRVIIESDYWKSLVEPIMQTRDDTMESIEFHEWLEETSLAGVTQTPTEPVAETAVVPDSWGVRSRRYWTPVRLGKLTLVLLSAVIATKAGLALDRTMLALSMVDDRASQQRLSQATEGVLHPAVPDATHLFPADLRFTESLTWLSQSPSGLKFAMPGEHFQAQELRQETQAVVQELLDIPLRVDRLSQVRESTPGLSVQQAAALLLDMDPEMLKLVAEIPDPEVFAKGLDGKSHDPVKKDPFSQKELLELASMR